MTAATDRLTQEVAETRTAVMDKLAKMQEQIDILTANPGDEAAVTAAADALDALQTELVGAVEQLPEAPAEGGEVV